MKRKRGFTLVETIIYIFISMIIIEATLNLTLTTIKSYYKNREETIIYNDIQNFYLLLDEIKNNGENKEIIKSYDADKNTVEFIKDNDNKYEKGVLKLNSKKEIVIEYTDNNKILTYNTLIGNIERMDVEEKGKIIYLKILHEKGKEFICCI